MQHIIPPFKKTVSERITALASLKLGALAQAREVASLKLQALA